MRKISFILLSVLLLSCSESRMLQTRLQHLSSSVEYLHDSPKYDCPQKNLVYLNINNNPLDSITTVSKMSGLILPFIIFNHFETTMKVKLGQNSIQEDYSDFLNSSMLEESKRSGCFSLTNQKTNDSIYTLDLTIDTCSTTSIYKRSTTAIFLFFAYSISYGEYGSPAETNLQISAKFRKANTVIFEKKYVVRHQQPFVNTNTNKLLADFNINMVEGLSLSTKQSIEQIVADINTALYGSVSPMIQQPEETTTDNKEQEAKPDSAKEEQSVNTLQSSISAASVSNQLAIGDKVKFYNFNNNSYITATVKTIKLETVLVEYESFGKVETKELSITDVKKVSN